MSENENVGELHGCIVCARLFDILAVYAPDGRLVDCTVTAPAVILCPINDDRWWPAICIPQKKLRWHTRDGSPRTAKNWMMNKKKVLNGIYRLL